MAKIRHWSTRAVGKRVGNVPFMLICCVCFTFTGVVMFWPPSMENQSMVRSNSNTVPKIADSELLAVINKIRKNSRRNFHFMSPLKIFGRYQKNDVTTNNHTMTALEDSQWQRANSANDSYKLLVYSAYWDNRNDAGCVRIIAVTLTKSSPPIQCRLRFNGITESIQIQAVKKPLNEHWNLKYASYLLSCCIHVEGAVKVVPDHVSVYVENQEPNGTTLDIRNNLVNAVSPRGQLAVCVKPFHYNYNRATWLIEFIEYNMMMGVGHFLFYNNTVGPDVQRVLKSYQDKGVVTVQPWKLDVVTKKEIRTEGMFGALNDCNYRLMFLFKYVLVLDIDEYVVPKKHSNYLKLLNSYDGESEPALDQKTPVKKKKSKCIAGVSVRNFFFYMYWENDTTLFGHEPEKPPRNLPYLLTQYKTRRLVNGNKHGQRSKYFVAPDKTFEIGNHAVWRRIPGCETVLVAQDVAALHHYRICEFGGYECLKKDNVIDRVAHKFGIDLLTNVLRTCFNIFPGDGSTCPITEPLGSPW